MSAQSPKARSMAALREAGYLVADVEKRLPIPGKFVTQDLFGVADLLAVRRPWATPSFDPSAVLLVQVTSGPNVAARCEKIRALEALPILKGAGFRVLVHGWRKLKGQGWQCREVEL